MTLIYLAVHSHVDVQLCDKPVVNTEVLQPSDADLFVSGVAAFNVQPCVHLVDYSNSSDSDANGVERLSP